MDLMELKPYEFTDERRARFVDWATGLIHDDAQDIRNDPIHFATLAKPLSESRIALVSTGGLRLKSQAPFDVLKSDGDWTIRAIPSATPREEIRIDHTHYNHGDADDDVNCMFPIERVRDLVSIGFVGSVTETFFGMMGFIPNGTHVVEQAGPEIARRLKAEGADIVLLTPS